MRNQTIRYGVARLIRFDADRVNTVDWSKNSRSIVRAGVVRVNNRKDV